MVSSQLTMKKEFVFPLPTIIRRWVTDANGERTIKYIPIEEREPGSAVELKDVCLRKSKDS